jgi:tetratricopeptide (TPR) repeat protein
VDLSLYRLSRIGVRVAMAGYLVICGGAFVVGLVEGSGESATIGALGLAGYVIGLRANRRWRRLQYELEWSDATRVQQAWLRRWALLTPTARRKPYYRYLHGCVLACNRQWAQAMEILVELARSGVPPSLQQRAHMTTLRCMIELDRAPEAATAAAAALRGQRLSGRPRGTLLYVQGLAQLRAGRFALALATLDEAAPLLQYRGQRAACSFSRGEALHALGRHAEASAAFAQAERLAPKCYAVELARSGASASRPILYN